MPEKELEIDVVPAIKQILKSSAFKWAMALLGLIIFAAIMLVGYENFHIQQLITKGNVTCNALTPQLNDIFASSNNTAVDSCNCFYEYKNTGIKELDGNTTILCTCSCVTVNGTAFNVSLRGDPHAQGLSLLNQNGTVVTG